MKKITTEIMEMFKKHGHMEYGEGFSVISHSAQAGLIAKEQGLDEELILAAFLHDIGHLCPLEDETAQYQEMGNYGIHAHDRWGEDYLAAKGFSARLVATVKNHVKAKRYLCQRDPAYHGKLSEASKQTLQHQGGPMTEEEALVFESDPFFKDSLRIRKIDEAAKYEDFEVLEAHWVYFEQLLHKFVTDVN